MEGEGGVVQELEACAGRCISEFLIRLRGSKLVLNVNVNGVFV